MQSSKQMGQFNCSSDSFSINLGSKWETFLEWVSRPPTLSDCDPSCFTLLRAIFLTSEAFVDIFLIYFFKAERLGTFVVSPPV